MKRQEGKGGRLLAIWKVQGLRMWLFGALAATAIGTGLVGSQLHYVSVTYNRPGGTHTTKFWTFRSQVRKILAEAKIPANAHNKVSLGLNRKISGNMSLHVKEAIPIWVRTAHRHFEYWATDYKVKNVLAALKIQLGPLDVVKPGLSQKLSAGAKIDVIRRWLASKTITTALPFATQYKPDPNLYKGHNQISNPGQSGQKVTTVQVLYQNGKPVSQKTVSSKVTKAPEDRVVLYGTAQVIARGGQVVQFSRRMAMVSTGYWPDPAWSNGYTATGLKAQYGVVAVDPSVIPLGTHLYIPGYGFAIAADTGSAIIGDRIDLCFNSGWQAIDWGVRDVTVYILN